MNFIIYLLIIILSIYVGITWILPRLIASLLIRIFKIKVSVGQINLLPFSLKNVNVYKSGYSVQIAELSSRSSFFNSDVTKLVSIHARDIRINKDVQGRAVKQNDDKRSKNQQNLFVSNIPDFRNIKVPPKIIKIVQFMTIHIQNVSVVLINDNFDPECYLHGTAKDISLDGSIGHNAKTLLVSTILKEIEVKILRNCPMRRQSQEKPNKFRPCLAEVHFNLSADGVLIAQGPISVENLQLSMSNNHATIYGGFYDLLCDRKQKINTFDRRVKEIEAYGFARGDSHDETYEKISPIIPKSFALIVEGSEFSALKEDKKNDFTAKLQLFTVYMKQNSKGVAKDGNLPNVYTKIQFQHLNMDTKHEKLLFVEQLTIDLTMENDILHVYGILKSFQLIYNHSEVYSWVNKNFLLKKTSKSQSKLLQKEEDFYELYNVKKLNVIEWLLKRIVIKGCADLWNISTLVQLNDHNASFSLSRVKVVLEQLEDIRSKAYNSPFANLLLGKRHWRTELMIESFGCSLANEFYDTNNLKKCHSFGNPFFLGVCLVKLSSYTNTLKLDVTLQTLRTGYSTCFVQFILNAIFCMKQYGWNMASERKQLRESKWTESNNSVGLLINAQIEDIAAYFINKYEACIFVRFNKVTLMRTHRNSTSKMEELQMGMMRSINLSSGCMQDLTDVFGVMKSIRVEYERNAKNIVGYHISIFILEEADFMWNSNLHMHILSLIRDLKELKKTFIMKMTNNTPSSITEKSPTDTKIMLNVIAERNVIFDIKISERHTMQWVFQNFFASQRDEFHLAVANIFVKVDHQHILTFKNYDMQTVSNLEMLKCQRQNCEGFVDVTNNTWVTKIGVLKIIFPYDHEFSDAVQNEFVSLFKWLKIIHNIKKKEFTKNSTLPSDMVIQVKEFLLEMSDDPFEVKLRDNYVLLVDEYLESLKRQKLFEQKLAERCSERLLVPAETIESLYANLEKKNSEIYIQRSKKIKESGPTRTRLLAWIMTDLEIVAMADSSIHGTENVAKIMREIDAESPWPEEGLQFVTLWCRSVNVSCTEWKFMLRDFPQPMFYVKSMRLFGNLCGAEQAAPKRAKRDVHIDVGDPFGTHTIQRGMTALKFYHDFDCELEHCSYAFGPCWEPVMAQCNMSFEKISAPSRDPSPVMPFWDKMRLLFHGRLTMLVKQFTVLLHASLDPYNTTEEMEVTWNNCGIIWTNAKIMFKGELNVSVRTASRYDDCRLLYFPNLKLTFKLNWICLGNPNDHHAVIPCAPDKLPEYSSNQIHDSFRAFRSQNLNIWVSFETKPIFADGQDLEIPSLVLYGSTLRWFESLKLILSGVTRPTRRGPVFNNIRPRKKQLSRHYKKANLQMSLHKFQILYWLSHALNRGFQLNGGRVSFSSEYMVTLCPYDDTLIRRPRSDWSTVYMNCELNDAEIWLRSTLNERMDISSETISNPDNLKKVRFYFLSVAKVSYTREAALKANSSEEKMQKVITPTHKLVVYDLKGAWTKNNRDVAFALFDSFMKTQKLKNNLCSEALKGFRNESTSTPLKSKFVRDSSTGIKGATDLGASKKLSENISSSLVKPQQQNYATTMLQQLIAEAEHKSHVYSDDYSSPNREVQLQGLQACNSNDVIHENWFISLVNSQVLLKGCETSGYVILSAAKAEILQRQHRAVWRDRSLVTKTTWKGSLECMQYYATVSAGENDSFLEKEIMWLTVENIQEKDKDVTEINCLPDLPHLVGSGQSVGGVVSATVGASIKTGIGEKQPIQLQRIVSRCKCEFFYVSYGDTVDPATITEVPTPPSEETLSPWERLDEPADAFTLMHHDLDVCTNSLQYAMILDIVNNLMLYVEPQKKQALEKLTRMRFQLQLNSSENQKRPIQHLQTQIRSLMTRMRSLEKDIYLIGRARAEEGESEELRHEYERVQDCIRENKDLLTAQSEELDMMLLCYKETQLSAMSKLATVRADKPITIVRANEICFKRAQWRLTEPDGQIGIADLILSDFLYTKKSKSDDSVEHLLELGNIHMNNLIPREVYKQVICPTELQKDMPIDTHKRVLRVFCREKPPVGGISVKEHFEINVAPITIAITKKFYTTMLKFCFPDRDTTDGVDDIDDNSGNTGSSSSKASKKSGKSKKSSKDSEFYVKIEKDDVEKMKERAEKNKLFIYIKIPEVPVRVSYKGNKEKNLEDIANFSLVIPTLEYHNVTWTWLDLLLAMKNDSRRVILSQAIKQKLQIHRRQPLHLTGERGIPQEEDKAKMLFGNRHAAENRSLRKSTIKLKK